MTDERVAELKRLCDALGGIYKIECQHCQRMTVVTQGAQADMLAASAAIYNLLAEGEQLRDALRIYELSKQPCMCSGSSNGDYKQCKRCAEIHSLKGDAK